MEDLHVYVCRGRKLSTGPISNKSPVSANLRVRVKCERMSRVRRAPKSPTSHGLGTRGHKTVAIPSRPLPPYFSAAVIQILVMQEFAQCGNV